MADQQRDGGQEPLTVREREALQELARAIVREAGLVPDPDAAANKQRLYDLREARSRRFQGLIEFYKHMTTLESASIVGVVAVTGAFYDKGDTTWPVYISLGLIGLALLLAGFSFGTLSGVISASPWQDETLEYLIENNEPAGRLGLAILFTTGLWYLGLLVFSIGTFIALRA